MPEIEGWHLFGDAVTSRDLCDACLAETSAEGAWDRVERLDVVEMVASCACGEAITARATEAEDARRIIERWLERHATCQGARA